MKIGIVSLTSCSGCQMALLDQKELLDQLLNIKYATTLFDNRELPEMDFCIIEGAVRTDKDVERLLEARKKAKVLISMGSCAVFGGVSALGNLYLPNRIIQAVAPGTETNPFSESPKFTARVQPVDELVSVEYFVPGCPPSSSVLDHAFSVIFLDEERKESRKHRLPVCAECSRTIKHMKLNHLEMIDVPEEEVCLLSQGYICLGSVTRGGCGAQCPKLNVPCSGCRGPTDRVLTKPTHTVLKDFVGRVANISGRKKIDVEKEIRAIPWLFYPFTFASQSLRRKPHSKILELQAPLSSEEE